MEKNGIKDGNAMTEWNVVLVIAALIGLFFTVGKPVVKLNTSITKLTTRFDDFTTELQEFKNKNENSHDKLWDNLHAHDKKINEHDTRITVLEKKG